MVKDDKDSSGQNLHERIHRGKSGMTSSAPPHKHHVRYNGKKIKPGKYFMTVITFRTSEENRLVLRKSVNKNEQETPD